MTRKRYIFLKAFKASLPILMGYGTMGFASGVVFAASSGTDHPAVWSGAIGACCLSGTLQFAIGEWMGKGLTFASVALLTFAISFRYGLYGFSLIERWRGIGIWRKLFLILGLADENYALEVGCSIKNREDYARFCTILTALNISYWFMGTTIGAFAGATLPIPHKGIEFVMAALFIAIFTDQVKSLIADHPTSTSTQHVA